MPSTPPAASTSGKVQQGRLCGGAPNPPGPSGWKPIIGSLVSTASGRPRASASSRRSADVRALAQDRARASQLLGRLLVEGGRRGRSLLGRELSSCRYSPHWPSLDCL